jgi:excisionase family DNA binding protein
MTVHKVAKLLDVSQKRVYQLICAGRVESLKLGPRTTRITRDSVDAYRRKALEAQRRELGLDIAPQSPPRRRV